LTNPTKSSTRGYNFKIKKINFSAKSFAYEKADLKTGKLNKMIHVFNLKMNKKLTK